MDVHYVCMYLGGLRRGEVTPSRQKMRYLVSVSLSPKKDVNKSGCWELAPNQVYVPVSIPHPSDKTSYGFLEPIRRISRG